MSGGSSFEKFSRLKKVRALLSHGIFKFFNFFLHRISLYLSLSTQLHCFMVSFGFFPGLLNQSSADKHKTQEQKTDHRLTDSNNAKESRSQKHNRVSFFCVPPKK